MRSLSSAFRSLLLLAAAAYLLGNAALAQGLAPAWTYDSPALGAGRQVYSVGTFNVGTDGSLAFILSVDDGSLNNFEYKLLWVSAEGNLLWESDFATEQVVPLAVRGGLLAYLEGGQRLRQVTGNSTDGFTALTVTTFSSSDTSFSLEQGRSPSRLFIAETAADRLSFTIHAYRLDTGNTSDLTAMFAGVAADEFTLFFPSVSGELYQVEKSTDMVNWQPVGQPIQGTDSLQSYTDTSMTGSDYYRVRKL